MNTRTSKSFYFLIVLISFIGSLSSQQIGAVKTTWDGELNHWTMYEDDSMEEEVGTIELRWTDRWDVWDYRVGEETGTIRMKWKNNPQVWELKANNQIIIFETVWKGDWDTWRIRTNDRIIKVSVRDKKILEEWETGSDKDFGYWGMWTEYEHELNSWIILDELNNDIISAEVKMAMMFIPIIVHFPKS